MPPFASERILVNMRSNPFRFLLLATLLMPACIETAEALNTVKAVPPPIERGAPEPSYKMQDTLCCAEVPATGWVAGVQHEGTELLCVQPRVGQDRCDAGTVTLECSSPLHPWRIAELGPIWECR